MERVRFTCRTIVMFALMALVFTGPGFTRTRAAEQDQETVSEGQSPESTGKEAVTEGQSPESAEKGPVTGEQSPESVEKGPVSEENNRSSDDTKENAETVQSPTAEKSLKSDRENVRTAKSIKLSGKTLTFMQKVETGRFLSSDTLPDKLKLKAGRKKNMLTWKKSKALSNISGFIVLRKSTATGSYKQIAILPASRKYYTDKTAAKKNQQYTYCIVSYKKGDTIQITDETTDWVSGVITGSRKVNVYSVKISNLSKVKNMSMGTSVKMEMVFPKKAVSTSMRWCSSDTNIVTVNNKGLVYAKSVGNAVITGRTATGYTVAVKVKVIEGGTAQALLKVMSSWLNYSESNRKHRKIIDIYNSYGNLPVGYKVKYSDAWCDTCVSAAAIISGNVAQIGRECGVTRHVELFKKKKIWIENGSIIPKPGYLIVYNWGKSRQPNNSGGSHIGVVYSVKKRWITTLEGNYGDKVKMRRIPVGWGFIRGYAKPKYRK